MCHQKSIAVAKTKIELDWHTDNNCLIIKDCIRPVNQYGYEPRAGSKQTGIANASVAYDELTMSQFSCCW